MFRAEVGDLRNLYEAHASAADFLLVYIREAHATDEWVMPDNVDDGINIPQPLTHEERVQAALAMRSAMGIEFPIAIDGLDDTVMNAYGAWPERLYVVGPDGHVAYQGGQGPWGYSPDEVAAFLNTNYGAVP